MVLTEAFASGTPVVASDIAGYRDVARDGQDSVLVPVGDAVALGETLRALAFDPARRSAMAEAARERADRFAWPNVAREVAEVYEEALGAPQPEGRVARLAQRTGMAPTEPGPRVPPQRLPSLEPKDPSSGRRRVRAHGPARARGGRRRGGRRPGAARAAPARDRVDRARDRGGHAGLGAGGLRADVRVDAPARRGLERDPARRTARHPRAPPRHRARHHDRGAHVGDAAGAPRRALARADRGEARGARARPLPDRARHARLPDAPEHPRADRARRRDVQDRRALPGQRGRARGGHDRARGDPGARALGALAAAPRQAHPLPARAAGRRARARRDGRRCAPASRSSASRSSARGRH